MSELLFEILVSASGHTTPRSLPETRTNPAILSYLSQLSQQSITSITSQERHALSQASYTTLIGLQTLSKKSHTAVVNSASQHQSLATVIPSLNSLTTELQLSIPKLDQSALRFSSTYSKSSDNEILARRKQTVALLENSDRMVDVLELPSLLSLTISNPPINYSAALDLNNHVGRLHSLHAQSALVTCIHRQADEVVHKMSADLVMSLRAPGLKLATSLRSTSWLRRLLPDLVADKAAGRDGHDYSLASTFLLCRMAMLVSTLSALDPLRELAVQESIRQASDDTASSWSGGQQTERYLKRYIEIFREQSFGIISMYRSMFPNTEQFSFANDISDPLQRLPPTLSTFPLQLADILLQTLRDHLPAVRDQAARDSIIAQVLYCAGSLGRLGGDFGMLLAELSRSDGHAHALTEIEWTEVVKRNRMLAGRLESVIGEYKGHRSKTG